MENKMSDQYFKMFFKETDKIGSYGFYKCVGDNIFTFDYSKEDILKIILSFSPETKKKIREKFVMIDFKNGNIQHFIDYLLDGYCELQVKQALEERKCK